MYFRNIIYWLLSLRVYCQRRLIIILILGFSAGLPNLLIFGTLTAWLSQVGIDKTTIGLFTLTTTAFALKFFWAPLVDSLPLPIVTYFFGQRRSWLIVSQLLCMVSLVGIAFSEPSNGLGNTVFWTVLLAYASATQDIVIDAYRIETLSESEQGAGAALYQLGYRVALILAGAGALIMADIFGWVVTYTSMGTLMLIGIVTSILISEPKISRKLIDNFSNGEMLNVNEGKLGLPMLTKLNYLKFLFWIRSFVIAPFKEFSSRPGWIAILLFIIFYKYADGIWAAMANPFYLELGFSLTEIGVVSKTYGVVMTILGSLFGGVMVVRLGIVKSVLFGVISMALTNFLYAILAIVGPSIPFLVTVISVENFVNGIGGTAFIAYLSSLCNLSYTATQYALLSSFMNFSRTFLAAGGGWLADQVDWFTFFIITVFAGLPGLMILIYLMRRYPNHLKSKSCP